MPMTKWLSAVQVAELLHVSSRTVVEDYAHRTDFPQAFKPGKRYLWDAQEIEKWVRRSAVKPNYLSGPASRNFKSTK